MCDCIKHCPSAEDEVFCNICLRTKSKKEKTATCVKSRTSIKRTQVCDGRSDCKYEEDEKNCYPCPTFKPFSCKGNRTKCLSNEEVCDGVLDCPEHEDEASCENCPDGRSKCEPNSTACLIKNHQVCDGKRNCPDGEDEAKCSTCPDGRFKCTSETKCINQVHSVV